MTVATPTECRTARNEAVICCRLGSDAVNVMHACLPPHEESRSRCFSQLPHHRSVPSRFCFSLTARCALTGRECRAPARVKRRVSRHGPLLNAHVRQLAAGNATACMPSNNPDEPRWSLPSIYTHRLFHSPGLYPRILVVSSKARQV